MNTEYRINRLTRRPRSRALVKTHRDTFSFVRFCGFAPRKRPRTDSYNVRFLWLSYDNCNILGNRFFLDWQQMSETAGVVSRKYAQCFRRAIHYL